MLITRLHKFITVPSANKSSLRLIWLSLSLTFAAIYSILALQKAFSGEYVVQDDARQHVFWMRRFLDPTLFPNDLIADYFQSVAPLGYSAVYHMVAAAGIDPLLLSKLLPLVLGLTATGYCFGVCLQLLPVPLAGFIAALLLNQNLWMQDGFTSATPKAFIYPLFLAFLYYFLRRSLLPFLIAIALLGLFYPSFIFICAGILVLQLWRWEQGRLRLKPNRSDYFFCVTGLGVALLVLLPYVLASSEFGPVIRADQARTLPEFSHLRRSAFFDDNDPWRFWFNGSRSGIRLPSTLMPPLVYAGFLLPILLRYPSLFPLAKHFRRNTLLAQIVLASFGMFFAAHAMLFKLHLPSRYTQHTLRIVFVIAAAIALTLMLDAVFALVKDIHKEQLISSFVSRLLPVASCLLLGAALVLYPTSLKSFFWTGYIVGEVPALYEFFQAQPKDILIASLSEEVNNLPTFSQRSILVGSEYAIPYHLGYYRQFRQRTIQLIQAQYSQNLAELQNFIQKYEVDFWLLDKGALTPAYIAGDRWFKQFFTSEDPLANLQQGLAPALASFTQRCSVFETEKLVVLQADCITRNL